MKFYFLSLLKRINKKRSLNYNIRNSESNNLKFFNPNFNIKKYIHLKKLHKYAFLILKIFKTIKSDFREGCSVLTEVDMSASGYSILFFLSQEKSLLKKINYPGRGRLIRKDIYEQIAAHIFNQFEFKYEEIKTVFKIHVCTRKTIKGLLVSHFYGQGELKRLESLLDFFATIKDQCDIAFHELIKKELHFLSSNFNRFLNSFDSNILSFRKKLIKILKVIVAENHELSFDYPGQKLIKLCHLKKNEELKRYQRCLITGKILRLRIRTGLTTNDKKIGGSSFAHLIHSIDSLLMSKVTAEFNKRFPKANLGLRHDAVFFAPNYAQKILSVLREVFFEIFRNPYKLLYNALVRPLIRKKNSPEFISKIIRLLDCLNIKHKRLKKKDIKQLDKLFILDVIHSGEE